MPYAGQVTRVDIFCVYCHTPTFRLFERRSILTRNYAPMYTFDLDRWVPLCEVHVEAHLPKGTPFRVAVGVDERHWTER